MSRWPNLPSAGRSRQLAISSWPLRVGLAARRASAAHQYLPMAMDVAMPGVIRVRAHALWKSQEAQRLKTLSPIISPHLSHRCAVADMCFVIGVRPILI